MQVCVHVFLCIHPLYQCKLPHRGNISTAFSVQFSEIASQKHGFSQKNKFLVILCSPLVEQASLEQCNSVDHPLARLFSLPGPSHISAPTGSALPTKPQSKTHIHLSLDYHVLWKTENSINVKKPRVLLHGLHGGWAQVWCPALFSPSSAEASVCGIDPWSTLVCTGALQETTIALHRKSWRFNKM